MLSPFDIWKNIRGGGGQDLTAGIFRWDSLRGIWSGAIHQGEIPSNIQTVLFVAQLSTSRLLNIQI